MDLTDDQIERYARHIVLPEIGGAGQQALRRARVALVGVGGLSSPVSLYLAAAGIGELILIDHDRVSLSNLQRQILFGEADIGIAKVEAASRVLKALNSDCRTLTIEQAFGTFDADLVIGAVDLVIDGSDNYDTRFAVNRYCVSRRLPLVSGAAARWSGQMCLLAGAGAGTTAPCYRCLVPEAPEEPAPCETTGIVGGVTGMVGAHMAIEALHLLAGAGPPRFGRLWLFDALRGEQRSLRLPLDPACPECGDQSRAK